MNPALPDRPQRPLARRSKTCGAACLASLALATAFAAAFTIAFTPSACAAGEAGDSVPAASSPLHRFLTQGPAGAPGRFGLNALFTGLSFHPDGGEHEDYPRKLDDAAYWVLIVGGQIDADLYLHRYLLLRGSVSLFRDCADVWSGFYHIGPRLNLPLGSRFTFRVGIGPTLVWRQNWLGRVAGYTKDSFYGAATQGNYQTRFIWYGGDLDFEWSLNRRLSLLYANIPGWPEVITSNLGLRLKF